MEAVKPGEKWNGVAHVNPVVGAFALVGLIWCTYVSCALGLSRWATSNNLKLLNTRIWDFNSGEI